MQKKGQTTDDCSEKGISLTADQWRVPSKLSRRRFALGSVAVIGAAVNEAGAATQVIPLSAEARSWHLEKTDEVADIMDERHILDEDLKRVIQNAENTGEKLYQTDTDRFLSKLRVGDVTFYVEYSRIDKGYKIHTAYSHRFLLEED
jgi:hypothetical protein